MRIFFLSECTKCKAASKKLSLMELLDYRLMELMPHIKLSGIN